MENLQQQGSLLNHHNYNINYNPFSLQLAQNDNNNVQQQFSIALFFFTLQTYEK